MLLRKDSRENKFLGWREIMSVGDTVSHLAMHSSCAHHHPRCTEMFCLEYLEIGVGVSSDRLLILPKALVAYLIKVISVLVPSCMTGRFIATSSKKATGEVEGLLKEILISQVPIFQLNFTKGVIKLEGPVGTERRCYQCYAQRRLCQHFSWKPSGFEWL